MRFLQKILQNACLTALLLTIMPWGCAKIGSLQGGEKDTAPPRVDTAASTPNFATRFQGRSFQFVFNEWVTLSDVGTQVVVSPPLATRPDITLKGKAVRFKLAESEVLRPNTTYTINFGNAVKDFTENNPAKDLRFVFSTGDFLDSLRVGGSVVDAFTGAPVENMAVMLYDSPADSAPRKERPYYFAKTDKSGQFSIANVRAGDFRIVAIEDANQNLKWDESERIAFADSLVSVQPGANRPLAPLRISKEWPAFRLLDRVANRYGQAKFVYSGPAPTDRPASTGTPGARLLSEPSGDTLLIWYDLPRDSALPETWKLAVGTDTATVKATNRADFLKNKKLNFAGEGPAPGSLAARRGANRQPAQNANAKAPVKTVQQIPSKNATLDFNFPVAGSDTARWLLLEDSARVRAFSVLPDSTAPRRLQLAIAWKPSKKYELALLPGAVADFFGGTNTDTLRRNFSVFSDKQLGGLTLLLKNLKPGTRYVLQLMNGNNVEEERRFEADAPEKGFTFVNLPTATYDARVIEDQNGNGRWDPAAYFARRQPELIFTKKLEALRANWELEATFNLAGGGKN